MPGIQAASASTRTGTVLVHFSPALAPGRVLAMIAAMIPEVRRTVCRSDAAAPAAPAAPPAAIGGQEVLPPIHTWDGEAVLRHFDSTLAHGLSQAVAEARLGQFGGNLSPAQPQPSHVMMVLRQLSNWPIGLLAGSAVLAVATGGMADAVAIGCVVAINTCIGYVTESQTERTIRSLTGPAFRTARVRRDGEIREIDAAALVPGDILLVAPGSFVAADALILRATDLTADESALTGESMPVGKSPAPLARIATPLADRTNMLFRGTVITGGHGLCVVVATGPAAEISKVQRLAGEVKAPATPMQRQLDRLGRQIVLLSSACCAAAFLIGLWRGYGLLQMLRNATALAVAAVPEGLPAMATMTLALGIQTMRRHKVLVRRLAAVEALGSVQVLCLDKTGTLTQNRMSVVAIQAGMERFRVANDRTVPDWDRITPATRAMLRQMFEVLVLCNDAELTDTDHDHAGRPALNGSPTEAALVRVAQSAGLDIAALRQSHRRIEVAYRGENRKFMTTRHALGDGGTLVAVKGSPEEVLALCRWYRRGAQNWLLSDADRRAIAAANAQLAGQALRVLGVAFAETRQTDADVEAERNLVWLGLVGMADPLRDGMAELIRTFHTAGIHTIMITGDQSATAAAIAGQLDLSGGGPVEILDSAALETIAPERLSTRAVRAHVFARVSPADKLQIVQALQRGGRVVAMTGDGINDGPALKAADVGIAMGRAGTDIARDVGDVILEDDDLHTMTVAIAEGRTIYANSRKAIKYLLATNLSEILLVLGAIGAGIGQPLTAMQLLWINLLSDIFPALALSQEPPEPDVLQQPPRDPAAPIIAPHDLRQLGREATVLCSGPLAGYLLALGRYGAGPQAGTIAFNSLVIAQLLHAITARSERRGALVREGLPPNRYLQAALLGSFAAQGLAAFLPPLRGLLGSTPIGLFNALLAAVAGLLPFTINEAIRLLRTPDGRTLPQPGDRDLPQREPGLRLLRIEPSPAPSPAGQAQRMGEPSGDIERLLEAIAQIDTGRLLGQQR